MGWGPSAIRDRSYHHYEHRYLGVPVVGDTLSVEAADGAVPLRHVVDGREMA